MCDGKEGTAPALGDAAYRSGESVGRAMRDIERGQTINAASAGSDSLHGLPTRWELQERLNRLRTEAAVVEVCLANWTADPDAALRFVHHLRLLGYRV